MIDMSNESLLALIGDSAEYASFRVGPLQLGIGIREIREINKELEIFPLPGAPFEVRGVINLRGEVVTVLDMGALLQGQPITSTPECRLVIVDSGAEQVALLVEDVADIMAFKEEDKEPPPANIGGADGRFFHGVVKRDNGLVVLLNTQEAIGLPEEASS